MAEIPDPMAAPVLRWGVLGTGGIAHGVMRALHDGTRQRLVAAASRTLPRAQAFAAEVAGWGAPAPTAYGSYEDLVADPRVDVVYVATPHSEHYANARLALEAGKNVLVEKAFTLDEAQAQALADLARARGLFLMEAMWTRFLPHQIELRQRLEDGELGEIVAAHADMGGRDPYNPDGRMYSPYLGGGALLDRGIYPISWLVDLLGLPGDIHAVAQMTDTGVDGHTAMTLGWPARETTATAQASILTITPHLGWLAGTRALVRVPNFWEPTRLEFVFPDGRVDTWQWEGVRARGWEYMLAAVARSVADGATVNPLMPPEQSVAIMGLLDAVRSQIGLVWPTA